MQSSQDKSTFERLQAPGHDLGYTCVECNNIALATMMRGKAASRLADERFFNAEQSRYRSETHLPPAIDAQHGKPKMSSSDFRSLPPSPLLARPNPPQSNHQYDRSHNIDLAMSDLMMGSDLLELSSQRRPYARRQRFDGRRRARELLQRTFDRWADEYEDPMMLLAGSHRRLRR